MALNITDESSTTSEVTGAIQVTLYVTVILVGTLGNGLVCYAIYRQTKRRPNEYFILNLALTDLGASVFSIPLDVTELLIGKFPLGQWMCHVVYPAQTILMGTSVLTLLCLSHERHRAIVTPLKPRIKVKTAFCMISATWLIPLVAVSPYASILHLEGEQCQEKWPSEMFTKSFTLSIFILLYFIPLMIITSNYVRIAQKLFCERDVVTHLLHESRHGSCEHAKKRAKQNIKVIKVFVTAVIVFTVCLLPNHVLWIWHDFGEGKNYIHFDEAIVYCNIIVYMNSAINPLIFGKIQLRNCCSSKTDSDLGKLGSLTRSKMASKVPSFKLRARTSSDNTSRPIFFKAARNERKTDEQDTAV